MDDAVLFPNMRRKDRMMPEEDIFPLLRSGEYGVLAMCGPGGYGYGLPLNYAWEDGAEGTAKKPGRIYFHCAVSGSKLDALAVNNKVSFTVVGPTRVAPAEFSTDFSSVLAFGRVRRVEDADEARHGLMLLVRKYSPDFISEGEAYIEKQLANVVVLCLEIDRVSGKRRG